ncbi:hypothetical protein GQX74_007797 [Glossina fuscipes]|nr:hypothetical protein GQX74_007797 [Glossina fuscipes]
MYERYRELMAVLLPNKHYLKTTSAAAAAAVVVVVQQLLKESIACTRDMLFSLTELFYHHLNTGFIYASLISFVASFHLLIKSSITLIKQNNSLEHGIMNF